MDNTCETVYQELRRIYDKHRRKHGRNPDSGQMCCMWSTSNPPDVIEGTAPFRDMEAAFGVEISDDDAYALYDMELDEAARMIVAIRSEER